MRPTALRVRRLLAALALAACGTGGDDARVGDASSEGSGLDGGTPDDASDAANDGADRDTAADGAGAPVPLPALPLRTQSRWIVDANGKRFKLASVNWYGAESTDHVVAGLDIASAPSIAKKIAAMGFNSVRLPWSNEMFELDPPVDAKLLAANPGLAGLSALAVMDAVIDALAHEGLVVILDNHRSRADWCCDVQHGDGLWYTAAYPESSWLADWKGMAKRYASRAAVVGVDLRNELRPTLAAGAPSTCLDCGLGCPCKVPSWGGTDASVDWHGAAERGGNAVLGVNGSLLIMVEGLAYSTDLSGVYALPVQLAVPNRLVYAPHNYAFSTFAYPSYAVMKTDLGNRWGYILTQSTAYTAPLWVGEFGTSHASPSDIDATSGQGFWFKNIRQYLTDGDIDWAYWAVNGTEASGYSRTHGAEEGYGVLDKTWSQPALAELLGALKAIEPATQGP